MVYRLLTPIPHVFEQLSKNLLILTIEKLVLFFSFVDSYLLPFKNNYYQLMVAE
jgi:hypothetical protein